MNRYSNLRNFGLFRIAFLGAVLGSLLFLIFSFNLLSITRAESSSTQLVSYSIDGGGGQAQAGALSLEYSIGESQPVGKSSSITYTLESGFNPVLTQTTGSGLFVAPTPVPGMNWWAIFMAAGLLGSALVVILKLDKSRFLNYRYILSLVSQNISGSR